ncbi:MAG: N-acetyl-1-D-myo-inositol-2-amino-2-deoxy-alpha-D-glucopyranoside deacetylase [Streptosporangiales bacterium]|nr:N-acetyl-1-D-myo-inositol-2-amino-2-deoxy-alpha-D-glucopyranoside deacetylase [Streptosporangiales bacterium]
MSELPDRRIVLVHAHPDDETIGNGATMAKYAAEGALVTLVTCTLGEQGEILVPELTHLAAAAEDGLGRHRVGELAEAMRILGVRDHRFLGAEGKYRDTGMIYADDGNAAAPPDVGKDAFWSADLREAADELVSVLRETRPQVLVTYDPWGGYGHPDHVQAHRVAMYAVSLAAMPTYRSDLGEAWDVPKIYWTAMSKESLVEGTRRMLELGEEAPFGPLDPDGPLPPMVVPDAWITTKVDGVAYAQQKVDAMRAHATQISVDFPFFALSNYLGQEIVGVEAYRLASGRLGPVDADGVETDLFAGVDGC